MSRAIIKNCYIFLLCMSIFLSVGCNSKEESSTKETIKKSNDNGAVTMKNNYGNLGIYFLSPEEKGQIKAELKEIKPEFLDSNLVYVISLENRGVHTRYVAQELINIQIF